MEVIDDWVKNPVVIKAMQLCDNNIFNAVAFIDGKNPDIKTAYSSDKWDDFLSLTRKLGYLIIDTLEGEMKASMGDYIIRGVKGEFYPCKPDIFHLTYSKQTN